MPASPTTALRRPQRGTTHSGRVAEVERRWRIAEEAKKDGGWFNLIPIWCHNCGDVQQCPGHWSTPGCALCAVNENDSVRMQAVRAVTQPESLDREPLLELPPGLRPSESSVFRSTRRATARAAEDERAKICRWLRRQARERPELDARAMAELVKGREHLRSP
jgi:hypothetical protein